MGKPVVKGKVKIRALEYVCPECGYTEDGPTAGEDGCFRATGSTTGGQITTAIAAIFFGMAEDFSDTGV